MGRKRHNWDPNLTTRHDDGSLTSRCKNCGMTERADWFTHNGRVMRVLQWTTPGGTLLRVRPVVMFDAPKAAPPFEGAFPGVEVSGMPECPKTPDAWDVTDG